MNTRDNEVLKAMSMGLNATKQIKTIHARLDDFELFDRVVNETLADGWHLVKRYIMPAYSENSYNMLVAELERKVPSHD